PEPGLPRQPSLSVLLAALRKRAQAGREGFTGPAFRDLVEEPHLAPGGPVLKLLDRIQPAGESLLTARTAGQLEEALRRVQALVEAAHEEFERWLRRDPPG